MLIEGMGMDTVRHRAPRMIQIVAGTIPVVTIEMVVKMPVRTMIIDNIVATTVTLRGISRGGNDTERHEERRGHTVLAMMVTGGRGPPRAAGGTEGTAAAAGTGRE